VEVVAVTNTLDLAVTAVVSTLTSVCAAVIVASPMEAADLPVSGSGSFQSSSLSFSDEISVCFKIARRVPGGIGFE